MTETFKLKVVHISTERQYRGGERQLVWLHEGLRRRGIASTIICRAGGALARRDVDHATAVSWNNVWDGVGFARFVGLVRQLRPDIIHCHDSNGFTVATGIGLMGRAPVVVTRRVAFTIRATPVNRWRYARASRVIAVSSTVADECRKIAPHVPISVVRDGVMWNDQGRSRQEIRHNFGVDDECPLIGSVGFFTGEKNIELLFDVAKRFSSARPDAKFLLVGPMGVTAKKHAKLLPNVISTGLVGAATEYYRAFDFYISTSTREGLGSAVLDAVVRDIPVIAFDSGGVRDIFPAEAANIKTSAEDIAGALEAAIVNMDKSRQIAFEQGEYARARFSVDQMVRGNIDAYDQVLNPTGQDSAAA